MKQTEQTTGTKVSFSTTEEDDEYLLKHVNAVALMPIKGGKRISLLGRRIFNVLLHRSMDDADKLEHSAGLSEITGMANYTSSNLEQIKKTLKELMTTTVEWQSPAKNESVETWDACNLLSGVGITKDKKTGSVTVRWRFDTQIRDRLLKPDIYSKLSLEAITQFSSHPAMALYEICARYVCNPSHLTARQNWRTWWRPVLTGVSTNSDEAEYRFFKRDVLNKAIAEVNAKTNLDVKGPIEYKEINNRTVVDIQFEVRFKQGKLGIMPTKPLVGIDENDLPLIGRAILLGVKQKEIEKLIGKHDIDILTQALDELEKRLQMPNEKVGEVRKPGMWLKTVLERIIATKQIQLQPILGQAEQISKQRRTEWTEEWLRCEKDKLIYEFKNSSLLEQRDTCKAFTEHLTLINQPSILKQFNKTGWNHRMVIFTFISFLGTRKRGQDWDKPTADDLLDIAATLMNAK